MGNTDSSSPKDRKPFWMPWGIGGCLWRTILFLLGIVLTCFFLAFMKGCYSQSLPNMFSRFSKEQPDPYAEVRDTSIIRDWNDSIPGVEELPQPEDNYIPPVDSSSVITDPEDSISEIICDELIVFINSKDIKSDIASFARQFKQAYPNDGYEILYYNPLAGTMLLGVPAEKLQSVKNELPSKIKGIDFVVTTNDILGQCEKPKDPGFSVPKYDEYFKLIQAYEAWDITKGIPDVKVAIVDSYFDLTTPELSGRFVTPIHIPSKTANVYPPAKSPTKDDIASYCHGSHVAGIAVGAQNNKLGCSGIAPQCSWIPISLGNQLTNFNIMEGILYAVYRGADVINVSIGRNFPEGENKRPLEEQVDISMNKDKGGEALWEYIAKIANDHKCVIVKAAGNETLLMGMDPQNRSNGIIKVEAVDGKGQMADFSNFGRVPEANINYSTVSAPGVNLWSTTDKRCIPLWERKGYTCSAKDGLQEMSGTSMAAPVVTGAVALLKSKNKNLTSEQVINILKMTSKQFDKKHRIGPTIQLKDALDMTGAEALNFDDLMKNHNLLIGKWKSTHEVNLTHNDSIIDKVWAYFIFSSPEQGKVEYHTINSRRTYTADVKVRWNEKKVTFLQQGDAFDPTGDNITKDDFVCTPDENRLLKASVQRGGKERYSFLLEKVK